MSLFFLSLYTASSSPASKDSNDTPQKGLTVVAVREVLLSLLLYLRVVRSML